MKIVAFDTETSLIRPGLCAPPISCLSYVEHDGVQQTGEGLVGHNLAYDMGVICAEWPELTPLVFEAYEANRCTDTMLRGKLFDIARGCYRGYLGEDNKWFKHGYSLLELAKRWAGVPMKKEGFRLFYGPLRDVPLERWVDAARELQERGRRYLEGASDAQLADLEAAMGDAKKFRGSEGLLGMIAADPFEVITYPLDDARSTMAVYLAQETAGELLVDQFRQARAAWWLHLASAWGLRTNAAGVAALQLQTEKTRDAIEAALVAEGLVRKDGSRDTKKAKERMLAVCGWRWDEGLGRFERDAEREAAGTCLALRLTPANEPSLDADACKASGDEVLKAYAELTSMAAVLNKDVPALARAVVWPVHTHFDLAETGRRTSANPNVQNWRRLPGIRECFVPRKGRVFAQADYSGLELATLAQACLDLLGHSKLAEMLNAGIDPHSLFASKILGWSYEETHRAAKDKSHPRHKEADDARQVGKAFNFGAPGGLGMTRKRDGSDATLIVFARKAYGIEITHEDLHEYAKTWHATLPEMQEYFAYVKSLPKGEDGSTTLKQLRSDRIRGGAIYTAACNSFFQGLGADATAHAGWLIAKACYVDRSSPLFGSRIVNYVHDEFIVETDDTARAHEAAEELSRLMVLGASEWIPSIKLAAEPCLMRVWSKDAKTLRDASGRLVPWEPEAAVKQAA